MKFRFFACLALLHITSWPQLGAEEAVVSEEVKSRLIGPAVAGFVMSAAIHPRDADVAIMGVDMGLFFMTSDGGKNWIPIGPVKGRGNYSPGGGSANAVAFHPERTDTFWMASRGIYRSTDGGKTSEELFETKDSFASVAVDPSDTEVLYAGEGGPVALDWLDGGRAGALYKSATGGKTWTKLPPPTGDDAKAAKWTTIVIDPTSPVIKGEGHSRIYAIGDRKISRSDDSGKSWTSLYGAQPGSAQGLRLAVNLVLVKEEGREEPVLYGSFSGEVWPGSELVVGGIYRSEDRGQTWASRNEGLKEAIDELRHYAPRPFGIQRNTILMGHSEAAPKRLYCAILGDVFRSDDLGGVWEKVTEKTIEFVREGNATPEVGWFLPKEKGNIANQVFDERFQKGRHASSVYQSMMSVAQTDADRVLMAPMGLMTHDGGKQWHVALFEFGEAVKPERFGKRPPGKQTHLMRSTGTQMIVPTEISFDPFNQKQLAVAFMDVGAFISRDGGNWWELAWDGILQPQADILNQASQVLFDPTKKGRFWVVKATHGTAYRYGHYLYRSDDEGRTFQQIPVTPLIGKEGKDAVVDLVIEPKTGALLVMTTLGLYRSDDEGKTWAKHARDEDDKVFFWPDAQRRLVRPRALLAAPADPGTYFFRREIGMKSAAGLFRSRDGGRSWEQVGADKIGAVSSITFSEETPGLVYVAAISPDARGTQYGSYVTKLWRSTDLGNTWEELEVATRHRGIISIAVHPRDPSLLYLLCGSRTSPSIFDTALLRSSDAGKSWEMVDPSLSIATRSMGCDRVVVSPHDARNIYLVTNCGLWEVWDPKGKP